MAESSTRYETPILFLIFNRPDLTKIVFERIRGTKPKYLYIAADGPRKNHPEDKTKCQAAREEVLKNIDWNCKVETLYRESNIGCQKAVSEAITWFFKHVEYGIILEDDTLPDETFFPFVSELLRFYENDNRIFQIGGCNYNIPINGHNSSYFFSKYINIWGWGTWRRAWDYYSQLDLPKAISCLDEELILPKEVKTRKDIFERTFKKEIDSWDYLWSLTVLSQHGLSIIPRNNLITNLGFGANATRTKDQGNREANLILESFDEHLVHPTVLFQNPEYNRRIRNKTVPTTKNLIEKIAYRMMRK